jgi:hypothetical protein
MQPRTEARFAVGSRLAKRSAIWKLWVWGEEAYLASRMFGKHMKVSFHSSGDCQWSLTDNYVKEQQLASNAERHIARWKICRPSNDQPILAFTVDIPMSELRIWEPSTKNEKKVFWVAGAPEESTVRFLIYFTSTSPNDPLPSDSGSRRKVFSLRFKSGGWLVVLLDTISLSPSTISQARLAVIEQFYTAQSLNLASDERATLFSTPNEDDGCPGFIEICLTTQSR